MKFHIEILKKHLANPTTCNYQRCESSCTVIEDEETISFAKRELMEESYNKYTGIYMIYNEYTISSIRNLLDVINKKGAMVFFYYDNIEMFCAFLNMPENCLAFKEDDKFLLFFSEKDIETYFNQKDCQYPRIYLDVPKKIEQIIVNKKNEAILLLRQQVEAYYQQQDLKILRSNLRVLICSDLFNMGTVGCMVKNYEDAFISAGIEYKLTVEDYTRFHYYEEIYFLREVIEYRPSVVVGMNVSYASFPYYISPRLPIISQIDSGQYAANEDCYRNNGRYTVFLLPFVTLENVHSKEFIHSEVFENKAITVPFVADHEVYKQYTLSEKEKKQYCSEVCFIGNSTTSRDVLYKDIVNTHERFFMKGRETEKKQEYQKFMKEIVDECFELTDEQGTFLGYNGFFEKYMLEKFYEINCFWGNLEKNQFYKFIVTMELYLLAPIYRICIMDWVLKREFNTKIFGMRWSNDEKYNRLWQGEIPNGKELSKVYNASKIVLHSNIVHGVHRRFFEASLSGCLCICPRPEKTINLSGLNTYFREDEEVVYFDNKQELYRKIEYYLKHDDERKKIVSNCQRVINEKKLYARDVLSQAIYKAVGQIEKEASREENVCENTNCSTKA